MIIRNFVDKERYFDSVMLMRMAKQVSDLDGIRNVSAGMGTPLNKDTMQELGLLTTEGRAASVNDLILAIAADSEEALSTAQEAFFRMLTQKKHAEGNTGCPIAFGAESKGPQSGGDLCQRQVRRGRSEAGAFNGHGCFHVQRQCAA